MVIGKINKLDPVQQISNISIDLNNTENLILSINLKIDGLIFIILNENKIIKSENIKWNAGDWNNASNKFIEWAKASNLLEKNFLKTELILLTQETCTIPSSFFDESKQKLVLEKYLGKTDFVAQHQKITQEIYILFALNCKLYEFIIKSFKNINIYNQSAVLIKNALKEKSKNEKIILIIESNYFEIINIKNNNLNGHNFFNFETSEEFIFYLLSYVKHNNIDINKLELKLSGQILKSYKIVELIEKYFPKIEIYEFENKENKQCFYDLQKLSALANS